ncbi:MAG: thioesterase family protein [Propionibacteriales bacterium]|nr:thioesterase family protein [Propionibacteriales bacterium]
MRHTYECALRWADMDLLGHINNVAYLDYLQEARIALMAAHAELSKQGSGEGLVVVRHELDFLVPLKFRKRPVLIDSWVTEIKSGSFVASYEIYDEGPEGRPEDRTVYLRASSRLAAMVLETGSPRRISPTERSVLEGYLTECAPRPAITSAGESQHVYPVQVRWSDLDPYQHVNNVKYIEYFQEARIQYSMKMHQPGDVFGEFVVARIDVDYKRPIFFRDEPYQVHSWISRVGTTSAVFASEIRDGDAVLATTQVVTVGFDTATQKAAPLPEGHRARLLEELAASGLA